MGEPKQTTSERNIGKPLSLRAYAKHRGCSAQSVSKAIATGRLAQCVVLVNGEPKVGDVAKADAEWAANTDHAKAPGYVKERGLEAQGAKPQGAGAQGPPAQRTRRAAVTPLSTAVAREKNARADLAELEYRTKAGALVSAAAVEAAWGDMVAEMRTGVLAIPSKFKGLYPDLGREQLAALTELLCQALDSIADRSQPAPVDVKKPEPGTAA